ncbi:related to nuclear distribution protein RO11 [Cephalotrichum gorgonifer]|uniref:Related to nuclear distribution protein RO11 n=1 Tax=Cephalotrichum gorgonifer TaxID=2041049 RepID=A0AAE8MUN0_9PEZI|nr:related to nuclear distribution protein RO11 [Cephalotrichum gorgonifer]
MAEPPSSPPSEGASTEDALQWYKLQYEQLEQELIEFRESSRELEQELEKDIEGAEKRERELQEKAESLNFEVDEWKRKYRESKSEASAAQNALEKEITTLRDSNRTLQLRLRDTEVANDDFERQARNTTSSLEDLESKYNVAIERGVMLEEEIRMGEQEREALRIDSQRLREELSDVKIEVEVLQEKVRKQESRHLSMISTDISVAESSTFDKNIENSPQSTASSPLISTPPDTAELPPSKDPIQDPPSPPMSDASASLSKPRSSLLKTPASTQRKTRLPSADNSTTPKPRTSIFSSSTSKWPVARVPAATATPANRSTAPRSTSHKLPASNSLTHIRSLTAQVQRLEARVHSARSRLPARVSTPPRVSPAMSVNGMGGVPSTVTIRARKRTTGSTSSSVVGDDATPTNTAQSRRATQSGSKHIPRLSTSGVSRLSFGPIPNRGPGGESEASISRPSSRASISSGIARPVSRTEMHPPPRPTSRASLSGARTPLSRPRSSLGGSVHGHSASVGRFDPDEVDDELRTPSRRGSMYSKYEAENAATSRIPAPNRRQSAGRRASSGIGFRAPTPLEDLDETY